jgi:hypothetical protein
LDTTLEPGIPIQGSRPVSLEFTFHEHGIYPAYWFVVPMLNRGTLNGNKDFR